MKHLLTMCLLLPLTVRHTADAFGSVTSNVLLIRADALGWADTTLYGQTKCDQTPGNK